MNSTAEIIVNESDIDDIFESIYSTIISSLEKSLEIGSSWIIDSVLDHIINILRYNPLAGSSYMKLLKELNHLKNVLINIPNIDDNE